MILPIRYTVPARAPEARVCGERSDSLGTGKKLMFGMSMAEMTVVAIIALVILGPEKLPEVARMAGRGMRELRKASNLFRDMLLMEEAQQDAKKRTARRMAEEAERERLGEGAGEAATAAAATSVFVPAKAPAADDLDFMGPLDGPEDELPAMRAPQVREADMNPRQQPREVREVELSARRRDEGSEAMLAAESWREVHLHTLDGEVWR